MNRETLIEQLRRSACDAGAKGFIHWQEYMADAADMLEGVEALTFRGAPIIEGTGIGGTLREVLIASGLSEDDISPIINTPLKGYKVQSAATLVEEVAKATRVYRFEESDPPLNVRFFDHYENARTYANSLKYSLVGFDPETDRWSVDELGANYGC